MISGIEKLYCKSRLHAYIWRYLANKIFPELIQYFPPSPFVLEIGTGQGLGAIYLAERFEDSKFIAIDNEPNMVKVAADNVKKRGLQNRIRIEWGDALALDFPDSSFDAVISITVLHHVPGYEKAIAEVARVLKQGGIFLVIDFDFKASIFPRLDILIGRAVSIFSWSEMSETMRKAGFEILKIKSYSMGMFISICAKR